MSAKEQKTRLNLTVEAILTSHLLHKMNEIGCNNKILLNKAAPTRVTGCPPLHILDFRK